MSQPVNVQSGHSLASVYVSEKTMSSKQRFFPILWRHVRQAADVCVSLVHSMPAKVRAQTKRQHCAGIARASCWAHYRTRTRKHSYNEGNALQTIATQPLRMGIPITVAGVWTSRTAFAYLADEGCAHPPGACAASTLALADFAGTQPIKLRHHGLEARRLAQVPAKELAAEALKPVAGLAGMAPAPLAASGVRGAPPASSGTIGMKVGGCRAAPASEKMVVQTTLIMPPTTLALPKA